MRARINVQVNFEMQPIQSAEYELLLSILIFIHFNLVKWQPSDPL